MSAARSFGAAGGIIALAGLLLNLAYRDASALMAEPTELRAALETQRLTGRADEPVEIGLDLEPEVLPSGYLYSVVAEVASSSKGGSCDIVSGVPAIRVTCPQEGEYRLRVRVGLLSKSSCGGASAASLLDEMVTLVVGP